MHFPNERQSHPYMELHFNIPPIDSSSVLESSNKVCKPHFATTLVVMSHERNACSMSALQVYHSTSCVHVYPLLHNSTKHKGYKHGKSIAVM